MSMDRKNKCGRLTPAPPRLRRCPQLTPLDPSYASLRKAAQLEAQAAARAANGHPGDGGVPAGGPGNGAQGRGSNGSGLGGESGRPFNGQQQQQQQFPQHQQHAPPRPADQSRTGQPHQHPDSSLLTLASLSYQTSSPLAYQQPPGAIGSPRAALSGLDLLNAALSQATLSGGGGSGMGPSTPTTAHNLPGQSQLPSARLPPAPHLSPPPAHRPPFPGSTSHSGSGLFQPSHQTSHLIASSGASSAGGGGGGGGGGGSPFSTSPFAAPGSRALFLSSSYDAYAQERDGSFPSSLPTSTLRSAGASHGLPRHPASVRTRSFLESSTTRNGLDGNGSSADEGLDDDGTNSDDGEEFLPSSLSELLTEHEMERRMTRRNSNQPQLHRPSLGQHAHSQQISHHAGLHSTSAAAAFPINRLYSDSGAYTRAREGSPSGPWIESVPVLPVSASGRPADDLERTVGRRHGERPPMDGVFDSLSGDGLSRSPAAAPPAMYDSTQTLRPTAYGGGETDGSHDDPFRHPSTSPTTSQPARSNLAALWDRSAAASYGAGPAPAGATQTRHGFPLSSSPYAGPPGQPSHHHLLGTTHQPSHLRQLPTSQLTAPGVGGGTQPLMSPSSRALASHAPGMSLPGGLGVTLSRLHYQPAGTPGEGTSYSSNGLPDLAGLAYGNVGSSRQPAGENQAVGTPDPWRTLDGDGYPALGGGGGGPPTIHQPTPIKSGTTIANRADEDDEFADDVLFD
jgi:hypothetical protein